jgi:hypothetical protein
MTKMIISMKALTIMAAVAISATLFSFSGKKGGEGFEIFLNNKLLLQQFGSKTNEIKSIQLDQRFSNDQLVVKYHHCGQVGKNRSITIKDAQNKILKEWKFANVSAAGLSASDAAMAFKVKDILGLHPGKLNLYYSSTELPKGKLLVTLIVADKK